MPECVYVWEHACECSCPHSGSPGVELQAAVRYVVCCWGLNRGPLQEQQMFLTPGLHLLPGQTFLTVNTYTLSWTQWHTLVIPSLGRCRKGSRSSRQTCLYMKFKANLGYMKPYLKHSYTQYCCDTPMMLKGPDGGGSMVRHLLHRHRPCLIPQPKIINNQQNHS